MEQKPCLAIIGGDKRETILAGELQRQGYHLRLWNLAGGGRELGDVFSSPAAAAQTAAAVILPMAGLAKEPTTPTNWGEFFQTLAPGLPVITGVITDELRRLAGHVRLLEAATDPELAMLNSIPTAEGALGIAMAESPVTLHGAKALVLGFGRCGFALARALAAMGAKVTVVARGALDRAQAETMGFLAQPFSQLEACLETAAFIFNTVPAPVLTAPLLVKARNCYVIVDIASGGGTDFQKARELGLTAVLAPGLPGKVAPVTAGIILARVYPRLLEIYGVGKGAGL